MAEDSVIRKTSEQCGFENVNVVNPFAAVGALSKEILINVRDGKCIRINPSGSGKDALKE